MQSDGESEQGDRRGVGRTGRSISSFTFDHDLDLRSEPVQDVDRDLNQLAVALQRSCSVYSTVADSAAGSRFVVAGERSRVRVCCNL